MKKRLGILLTVLLSFVLITCFGRVFAKSTSQKDIEDFSLDTIDPSLSLKEVCLQYPEVFSIYNIICISDEEAEVALRNGARLINGDDYSAKEFLSMLNDRRCFDGNNSKNIEIKQKYIDRGPYGAAWGYVSVTGAQPNCYGYALGISAKLDPGEWSSGAVPTGASVNTVATKACSDMAVALNGGGRVISETDSIYSYEWRIACRIGYVVFPAGSTNILVWDYHFILQSSDGRWCHKLGTSSSQFSNTFSPKNDNWDANGFYIGGNGTIFLAIFSP